MSRKAFDDLIRSARAAGRRWRRDSIAERLRVVERLRRRIAEDAETLAASVDRRPVPDTLTAEVLPLADACKFLERRAAALLAPRTERRGRPAWLAGTRLEILREPLGLVLILAPSNYPLFLPGVQLLQALTAGNSVLVKPAPGCSAPMRLLAGWLQDAGLPPGTLTILDESVEAAETAIEAGVDKVLLTGSLATGQTVLSRLAGSATPATMELSGCDAVFVRNDADLKLTARSLAFALKLNGGATCIGPRRMFVHQDIHQGMVEHLAAEVRNAERVPIPAAMAGKLRGWLSEAERDGAQVVCGGIDEQDTMAPTVVDGVPVGSPLLSANLMLPLISVIPVQGDEQALIRDSECPYALGATVFGGEAGARALAQRIRAGVVVINDAVVPTADPRLPFGGSGLSGFGVTRGAEGLLELTRTKAVSTRSGRGRPHLDPPVGDETRLFSAYARAAHGSPGMRVRGWIELLKTVIARAGRK
ncbi:hypothetical protein ABI59_21640 [Acidobacteria bacterium Mor1]|nr:hypothetical protein ABI59_21640 [Acidobacteria bacterium Mor1]